MPVRDRLRNPNASLQVLARDTGDRLQAPRSNAALDLAESLARIRPESQQLIMGIGEQMRAAAEGRARADVLSTAGQAFGDAVREGRIERTQNPWYIQAYNREAAAVQGRQALTELRMDAQTWEERSDPTAFSRRWQQAVGEIAQGFSSRDQLDGFQPVLNEVSAQVLNSNTAENVERITRERDSNMGQLIAERLRAYAEQNAVIDPATAMGGLEDLREAYISTGGNSLAWEELVQRGVVSAAYGTGDDSLLDVLRHDGGSGAIYDRPGVADSIENDRFRIEQARSRAAQREVQERRNRIEARSVEGVDTLYEQFGTDLITGQINPRDLVSQLEGMGYDAHEIGAVFGQLQRMVNSHESLSRAALGNSNIGLGLHFRAATQGWSQGLQNEIEQAVLNDELSAADARSFVNTALTTSRRLQREADQGSDGTMRINSASALRTASTDLALLAQEELRATFNIRVSSRQRDNYQERIRAAAIRVTAAGGTYQEAYAAARAETAAIIQERASAGENRPERTETERTENRRQRFNTGNPRG